MIRKLAHYLKEFRSDAIKAPLLIVLEIICELTLPLLMANIIDNGIEGGGGMPVVLKNGLLMLGLSVISMFCGVRAAKHAAYASQGFGRNLRKELFHKIQCFSFADIDRFSSASLITRTTNDVNMLQNTVAMGLRMLVRAPLQLLTALVVCLFINARLTIILGICVPVICVAAYFLMQKCRKLFKNFQEKIDGLNSAVQENLVSIRVIKAFVRRDFESNKFKKANDDLRDSGLHVAKLIVMMAPMMIIVLNLAILAVFWFGGKQVAAGEMLTGELYSFFSYIGQVLFSVLMVAVCLLMLTRASACAGRIVEVLESEPDIKDAPDAASRVLPASDGMIEFKDVSFRYHAGTGDDVLSHISFKVNPGQFVAVIGGTGTGKSTLVNLIPRFYDVTGGSVQVDGMDVREYPIEELRKRIGMVLQKNVLFTGSIRENLLWGNKDATEEQIINAAKNAQIHEFIMSLPDGYDTFLEQGGVNVSGGQKQRLCIARAMLRHPSILILDDSTSAVDSATETLIRQSFAENLKGTSVIIIAQRISSVRNADKIIILEDDHIAAEGTHEELMATSTIYQEIYQSQQEGVISNG